MNFYETDSQLKNYKLPNGKKQIDLKDKKTENLYCRIRQSDKDTTKTTKTFLYLYKIGTTQKRITIGKYPSFSLNEARQKALEYATARDRGEVIKTEKEKALTFSDIATEWIEKEKTKGLAPKNISKSIGRIEKYLYPTLKDRKISEISRRELIEAIEKIQDYEAKNGLTFETSRRTYQILRNIMKLAVSKGYIDFSPISEIEFKDSFKTKPRNNHFNAITDPKRLSDFIKALYNNTTINLITRNALKFALHTALRTANVRGLKWSYIDFSKDLITIPADKMKMNKKANDFLLPISKQVRAILQEMQTLKRGEFVFYSDIARSKMLSENTINQGIKRLGFGDEMHGHGLRSTFSTIANANTKQHGLNSEIIELCLDHAPQNRIKAIYDRNEFLSERAELMQWYSDYLENLGKE
ncbi:MAG: site-specific integrase [Campylobacter sp.]|nr:site-specific integrase [Campylobacter sp.]